MPTITSETLRTFEVEGFIDLRGRKFAWWTEHDEGHEPPWEEDGHGPVSGWEGRDKRPGEMVLVSRNGTRGRYYDFAGAVEIAKRDGWDAPPFGEGAAGQRAHRAAMADFRRLRDWCAGRWYYVGVCVQEVEDGHAIGPVESVWGFESDAGDYLHETARELAYVLAGPEEAAPAEDEEAASLMEREALALVEDLAATTLNPIIDPVNGKLAGFIKRARGIVG